MKRIVFTLTVFFAGTALAGTDTPWWQFWDSADEVTQVPSRLFTEDERHIIESFFRDRYGDYYPDDGYGSGGGKHGKKKQLPPGLQKKLARGGELPPGWQKKVARGEVLDTELYGRSRSLPEELLRRLPRHVDGTDLRWLEDQVVRIVDDTHLILDVLQVAR